MWYATPCSGGFLFSKNDPRRQVNRQLNKEEKRMQQSIQEIFIHLQEMKRTQRSIRKEYQDVLGQEMEYQKIIEEIKKLRERKAQIEVKAKEAMGKRYAELEELKDEVASNQEMLSDVAMTTLMNGQTVEVTDEFENKYEPAFSVKFKKAQ